MMRYRSRWITGALLAAVLSACSHSSPARSEGPPPKSTVLRVVNRNFYDMTIFLVRFGDRVRLGLAPGNGTSTFEFPSQFVQSGTVRFEAKPVGSTGRAFTQEISVQPGDVIGVEIQP
jgi:hypothetical protein